jgi:drug/metabolite transporter (DMT)-like permease
VLAGLIATGGVAVMGSDRTADISSAGLALAFTMAFSMAMTTLAFRKHPDAGCWPVGCLSNALTATLSVFLAQPFAVAPPDLAYLLLFSLVQMTLGLGLFVMGTRQLPAADAAIIGLIEAPLAPLWVWLAFAEAPSGGTMIGGALVLAAAAGHIMTGHIVARRDRHAAGSSSSGGRANS